jgi:tryptophan-rich sensory protein
VIKAYLLAVIGFVASNESLMPVNSAIVVAIGICAVAAMLEGVCAGKNVKLFFAELQFPPYSAPLWVWSIIGGVYYLIFGFVLYRLLRLANDALLRSLALALMVSMMLLNALTNYVIFRAQNLRLSFIIGALFSVADILLFICLLQLDQVAAWSLVPYLIYRAYGLWWSYALWKINSRAASGVRRSHTSTMK